jgi:hypothetical protein
MIMMMIWRISEHDTQHQLQAGIVPQCRWQAILRNSKGLSPFIQTPEGATTSDFD